MNSLALSLSVLGVITSGITIATFFWKATNAIANLRTANAAMKWEIEALALTVKGVREKAEHIETMKWEIEALELTVNGVRERAEHIATRLQPQIDKNAQTIEDIQGYLQKNTAYERRGNR